MTDERLAEIEKTSIEAGRIIAEQNIKDLITALRSERKAIEQMQSDYTELENELRAERANSSALRATNNCLIKESEVERAKVAEFQKQIEILNDTIDNMVEQRD